MLSGTLSPSSVKNLPQVPSMTSSLTCRGQSPWIISQLRLVSAFKLTGPSRHTKRLSIVRHPLNPSSTKEQVGPALASKSNWTRPRKRRIRCKKMNSQYKGTRRTRLMQKLKTSARFSQLSPSRTRSNPLSCWTTWRPSCSMNRIWKSIKGQMTYSLRCQNI